MKIVLAWSSSGFMMAAVFHLKKEIRDAVFSRLRLWIDENHDGISQPNELHTLPELGVFSLNLKYFESRRTDEFGNLFRYKATINPDPLHRDPRDVTASGEPGRWVYDVFLRTERSSP